MADTATAPPPVTEAEHVNTAVETVNETNNEALNETAMDDHQTAEANGDDAQGSAAQGGLDRDVNSILANLNQEQLASIVAAARASEENGANGEFTDASSILAALPPHLGQAASALTSFASSFKREGEGIEGDQRDHTAVEGAEHAEQAAEHQEDLKKDEDDQAKHDHRDEYTHEGDYTTETNIDDSLAPTTEPPGDQTTDDYRNEHATQAAIAAMESLAAQNGVHLGDQSGKGRIKRDTGPEAERMRKDQHKEVERKRREQISNGISDLAAIVPGCDAKGINKTAIINAAVRYIMELKNNEASNIEKWTLEKLLMDQAMGDLNAQFEATRKELSRLRAEFGIPDDPIEAPQHYAEGEEGVEEHQEGQNGEHHQVTGEMMEGVEAEDQQQHHQHAEEQNGEAIDPNLELEAHSKSEAAPVDGKEAIEENTNEILEGVADSIANEESDDKTSKVRRRSDKDVGHPEGEDSAAKEDGARAKRIRNA